jgi:outer membrane protein assembly factor BamE (lipoprotein component of BamABCDE complex)
MITTSAVSATAILLLNARDAQLGPDSEMAASILVGMHLDEQVVESLGAPIDD